MLTQNQISERFEALVEELADRNADPRTVVLYALTTALSVARAALSEEEMEEVTALAFAVNVQAVIEESAERRGNLS